MHTTMRLLLVVTVLIPVCACRGPSGYMTPTASLARPDAKSAVVRFVRPSQYLGGSSEFAILDGDKAIGALPNGAQFDYVTTPGKHLFITPGHRTTRTPGSLTAGPYFLEADLGPGKTYYVVVRLHTEAGVERVWLTPITRRTEQWNEVPSYEKDLTRLEPNRASLAAWSTKHGGEIKALLRTYDEKWKHERQWATIGPDDGV